MMSTKYSLMEVWWWWLYWWWRRNIEEAEEEKPDDDANDENEEMMIYEVLIPVYIDKYIEMWNYSLKYTY